MDEIWTKEEFLAEAADTLPNGVVLLKDGRTAIWQEGGPRFIGRWDPALPSVKSVNQTPHGA